MPPQKKTKRACVINPWITDFKLYDEWMHPIGLYLLISLLKHNGWEVEYIDCMQPRKTHKLKKFNTGEFHSTIISKPPLYQTIPRHYKRYGIEEDEFISLGKEKHQIDLICIGSSMTYWNIGLHMTIETIHATNPSIPILIGGISSRLLPAQFFPHYCLLFTGQLPNDCRQLQTLHPILADISTDQWIPSLIAAYTLIPTFRHGPVITSFGCTFRCNYCASKTLQDNYHRRSSEVIIEEITYLYRVKGVREFAFYDDGLLIQAQIHLLPILEALKHAGIMAHYHVPNGLHLCYITHDVAQSLKQNGFTTIRCGYETSNPLYAHAIDHKINRQQVQEKIALLKQAGFSSKNIGIYIMAGLPHQTYEQVLDDLEFIHSCKTLVKPVFLSPVPTTDVFTTYTENYPILLDNPLSHNDSYFATLLPEWGFEKMERIKQKTRLLNDWQLHD